MTDLRPQLELYARDLKQVLAKDEERTRQLEMANRQLQAYAQDLKSALLAERQQSRELERSYHDTVLRLLTATRCRDHETGEHVVRIAHYARRLALATGWSVPDADRLFEAAPMHDVGKIGVPDAIIHKPGPLTAEEWILLKRHTEIGAEVLSGSRSPLIELARQIALTHHERWDGTGYPHGLKGLEIPLAGRVVMLVDQYDALRTHRPYKPALSHDEASRVLLEGDGRTLPQHFDPLLLSAFREIRSQFNDIHARYADRAVSFALPAQAEAPLGVQQTTA
jgi:putative two-component system response regulator